VDGAVCGIERDHCMSPGTLSCIRRWQPRWSRVRQA
jgi:hypothetical protein